jgi:hypothetical protein
LKFFDKPDVLPDGRKYHPHKKEYGSVWIGQGSLKEIAAGTGYSVETIRRNLHELVRKHVISPAHPTEPCVRKVQDGESLIGRRAGEGNITPTRYVLHGVEEIDAAIIRNPSIGKVMVNGQPLWFVHWPGFQFLTQEDLKAWNVDVQHARKLEETDTVG